MTPNQNFAWPRLSDDAWRGAGARIDYQFGRRAAVRGDACEAWRSDAYRAGWEDGGGTSDPQGRLQL